MKRKWIRRVSWVLLTPLLLFLVLMILLYVPPVQSLLRREFNAYASKATGMQIQVDRIDLRFPLNVLIRGVEVVQETDTILSLQSLNVRVEAWPLLDGRVELDEITLRQARVNTVDLVEGMRVRGFLGYLFLQSHGIDLLNEVAVINQVDLSNTHIQLLMNDTTAQDSTASAPLNWRVDLHRLKFKNVSFSMVLPADSMHMAAHLDDFSVNDVRADLKNQYYGLRELVLSGGAASYREGFSKPNTGFDASRIAMRDIRLHLDSVLYTGRQVNAVIRECSMNERSGLSIMSLNGKVVSNDSVIMIPTLKLQTPHSAIDFSAHTYWDLLAYPIETPLFAKLNVHIGKEDVLLFAGDLPTEFKKEYPFRPLVAQVDVQGSLKELNITPFTVNLPGAFSLKGEGKLHNVMDSLTREGHIQMEAVTQDLNFLSSLAGLDKGRIVIPNSVKMAAHLDLKGAEYAAKLRMQEADGVIEAKATLNTATEKYKADLQIDNWQLQHFLPHDSIYELSLVAQADGRGFDVSSRHSLAKLNLSLQQLHYARYRLSNVFLDANLKGALATAQLSSDNVLLRMTANGEYNLAHHYPDGKLEVDVSRFDLYELGLVPKPMKRLLAFNLSAEARKSQVLAHLSSGDMVLDLRSRTGVNDLMKQSMGFSKVLMAQIEDKTLDHAELRKALPSAVLSFVAGKENPLSYYLETKDISYKDASIKFGVAPSRGINGKASIHALKVDTFMLDTVYFMVKQDLTLMKLRAGVINGPKHPALSFSTTLTGEIRDKDAELMAEYKNKEGETGFLLGVNARPLFDGPRKADGLRLSLIPEQPIVGFDKFHFNKRNNWIYIHKNMRVYANVDMWDDDGMGFRIHSVQEDTVSLQNINVEIRQLHLDKITSVLPYFPEITGLFSAEAHYVQTPQELQVSAEASVDELVYERQRVGDIKLGATWLPANDGKQYVNAYLNHDEAEVLVADGKLVTSSTGKDSLEVNATLENFPLRVANVFIPDKLVTLLGDLDGDMLISGTTEQPLLNGKLMLDSVVMFSQQYGVKFRLDDRPVQIKNSRLSFDKFAIYTTSRDPFTIDGYVDFREMSRPIANLNMEAKNYTLLDAKRTRESLVYGKVYADFFATLKGPLDGLKMRGNMNLLGNTDVSYILTDSPLTVQDRLGSLVEFTSFSDTTAVVHKEVPTVSLGGLDMVMMVHIDPAVRVKVDLDASNDNRIELEGGGDLSMKYTPQGDLTLTGRYTLSGGLMKYALPVIAAKEFSINSGSYVEWVGDPMDPTLNFKATDRIRASVTEGENGNSRIVNFDVSVEAKNKLENLSFAFGVAAPEDATVQNELTAMGAEERGKQALYIMVMKTYLGTGSIGGGGGGGLGKLNMGSALTSVLSSQINSLMGNLKNASLSVGVEDHSDSDAGGKRTDYSFRYAQRLFNNRIQFIIGGKVSTGENVSNDAESFIDNISLEYRLDRSGSRYVRLFYDKNYESVLEGEIIETGVGLVLRKKLDKLSELFIFKRKQ